MLVDSLCYLLSSVSWDSAALNKTAVSISSQCAHKIPHHTISREHSAISKRTSKRTKWNFFFWCGRGQLLFFCDAMMKAFLRSTTRKLAKLSWLNSIRKPTEAILYDVWEQVLNVSYCCCCCCHCCYVVVHIRPHHLGSDEIQNGGHTFSVSLIVPNWSTRFIFFSLKTKNVNFETFTRFHIKRWL